MYKTKTLSKVKIGRIKMGIGSLSKKKIKVLSGC